MVHLLDVNLLISLAVEAHEHHAPADEWFKRRMAEKGHRWATCPITENGFVRILSNPNHSLCLGTLAETADVLRRLCADRRHDFWPDDASLRDASRFALIRVAGPRQLTDVYLLGLAVARGGRLATLEHSFPTTAVLGGDAALERVARLAIP